MENELLNMNQLSQQLAQIIFGTFFLIVGVGSAVSASLRQGKNIQILIWLSAWSSTYGIGLLITSPAVNIIFPQFIQNLIPAISVIISYMILVFALLTWVYLTRDKVRTFLKIMIILASVTAVSGISKFFVTGSSQIVMLFNNLLATGTLIVFIIILSIKKLSDKYFILQNRGVLAAGTMVFVMEALNTNLSRVFGYQTYAITGWLGFAALLMALAYTAAKLFFANERRLITIENEMETARHIQSSILPDKVPEIDRLEISAVYNPMRAVAGDFYEFIEISRHEAGILLADVSGHGVPAALIASMIKIAMQSVIGAAKDPHEVMSLLAEILGDQLHEQFLTAAYLYIDSKNNVARYTAAGHPPLLYWNSNEEKLESVESNGLIIGIPAETSYPVHEFTFNKNDLFLIYTDGLTETMNDAEEEFGSHRLDDLIRSNNNLRAGELSKLLLKELELWQPKNLPQQDDITFIIVDSK
jgi:sigma-B regulation protein RsbU (phosphoserine phosphatase)